MHEARRSISAIGWSPAAALGEALAQLLPLAQTPHPVDAGGRSATFRAEAASLDDLLPALLDAMLGQSDLLGQAIASIEVSGVIRSSDGLVAWGIAELAADPPTELRSVALVHIQAREELGAVTIDAELAM